MGIEQVETITRTYTCDRCDHVEKHVHAATERPGNTDGWVDVRLTEYDENYRPGTGVRTLCPSCKVEFQTWWLKEGF